MAFDYKKEYKEFYMPKNKPVILTIPKMNYIAVKGHGNPNEEDGLYKQALKKLYGIAFTIKMSKKGDNKINGYFDYVVPPLEGLWFTDDNEPFDYADKDSFKWISMIRLPDFVTLNDFNWAVKEAESKKKADFSGVYFLELEECECIQCMHIGSYNDEPKTIQKIKEYAASEGYTIDLDSERKHHEIYLSDPRRCAPERLKTVIREPVKKI